MADEHTIVQRLSGWQAMLDTRDLQKQLYIAP